jgi:hypothetical protein
MKPENIEFLEKHFIEPYPSHMMNGTNAYQEIVRAETDFHARLILNDLLRIMHEEFYPGYQINPDSCISCLSDMVKLMYRRYMEWKEANPASPLQKVHASFPKNHHRK